MHTIVNKRLYKICGTNSHILNGCDLEYSIIIIELWIISFEAKNFTTVPMLLEYFIILFFVKP